MAVGSPGERGHCQSCQRAPLRNTFPYNIHIHPQYTVNCSILLRMVFNIKISSTAPSSRGLSRAPPHHSRPSRPNTSPGVAVVEHDGGGCLALPCLLQIYNLALVSCWWSPSLQTAAAATLHFLLQISRYTRNASSTSMLAVVYNNGNGYLPSSTTMATVTSIFVAWICI